MKPLDIETVETGYSLLLYMRADIGTKNTSTLVVDYIGSPPIYTSFYK